MTSFLTVGGVWLAHHGLFSRLQAIDPVLMRLNLLLLMAVSFLPFPTALMAEALQGSESAERAAVVVYGATRSLIEVLGAAAWRYAASRPGLLADHTAPLPETAQRRRGTLRGALYGLAHLRRDHRAAQARRLRVLRRRGSRRPLRPRGGTA